MHVPSSETEHFISKKESKQEAINSSQAFQQKAPHHSEC